MNATDRLRQAAQTIRDTVHDATPGPWEHDDTGVYVTDRLDSEGLAQPDADAEVAQCYSLHQAADAALIALMANPPLAVLIADWLEDIAADKDSGLGSIHPRALDVTNLILGGDQ